MSASARSRQSNTLLKQRIDELETLLSRKKHALEEGSGKDIRHKTIPILDELAAESDFEDPVPLIEDIIASRDGLADATDRLEQKLTRELEAIIAMFKGDLKKRIARELRTAIQDQDKHHPDKKPHHGHREK